MEGIVISGGILVTIIAFFLIDFFNSIKELKKHNEELYIRVNIIENNHKHMDEKFDEKFDRLSNEIRDLTNEIKNLNLVIQKKKDQ